MIAMMFWFDWLLSLLVLAVYPLAMQPIIKIGNRQRKASGDLQAHMEVVTSLLAEMLQGIRMVKAYQETAETRRAYQAFDTLFGRLMTLLSGAPKLTRYWKFWAGLLPVLWLWQAGRSAAAR